MAKGKRTAKTKPKKRASKRALAREEKPATKAEQPGLFETAQPPTSEPPSKRIGMTLRLEPAMWVRLKNLSARLSVKMGRPVSAHELVVAGLKTLLLSYDATDECE